MGSEELISFGDFRGQVRSWWGSDLLIAQDIDGASDLWQLSLRDRSATRLFKTPSNEGMGRVSPDGRCIAYVSEETGQPEIYVQTFPSLGQRERVSRAGGGSPKWRGDGRELFFADTANRKIMAVDVTLDPSFAAGVPRVLIETTMLQPTGASFDVTADGQRFLVVKAQPDAGTRPITLVQNWTATLK